MLRPVLLSLGVVSTLTFSSLVSGVGPQRGIEGSQPMLAVPEVAAEPAVLEDVVAAAVIGSISRQFATADVTVQLDDVRTLPASIQDRQVVGGGRLQLAGDPTWIPFRFAGLYDTSSTEVTYPQLHLGDGAATATLQPALARSLGREVGTALRSEFADQPVAWSMDHATVATAGRYLVVEAAGMTDFGPEGSAATRVQALYDVGQGRWLRVNYELGADEAPTLDAPAVASL